MHAGSIDMVHRETRSGFGYDTFLRSVGRECRYLSNFGKLALSKARRETIAVLLGHFVNPKLLWFAIWVADGS